MPWASISVNIRNTTSTSAASPWNNAIVGNTAPGEIIADLIDESAAATGVSLHVTDAFGGVTTTYVDQAHHSIEKAIWDSAALCGSTEIGVIEFRGLAASTQYTFDFFGTSNNSRTRDATTNDGTWNNPAPSVQTVPTTPAAPTEGTFTTDGSGTGSIEFSSTSHASAVPVAGVRLYAASASGPTHPFTSVTIS